MMMVLADVFGLGALLRHYGLNCSGCVGVRWVHSEELRIKTETVTQATNWRTNDAACQFLMRTR